MMQTPAAVVRAPSVWRRGGNRRSRGGGGAAAGSPQDTGEFSAEVREDGPTSTGIQRCHTHVIHGEPATT
ncbi:hypothetical protein INR49_006625 [Caranx melampygus]|nr:hypothetical protein INR49_006625 [Caranx melampygus]